jgi:predicted GNAT family acetyltransferase
MNIDLDKDNLYVHHDGKGHRFYIPLGEVEAFIEYAINSKKIIFLHTEVPPAFKGKGIASRLTREALEFAKNNDLKVISLCSYISRFISRHPEYQTLQEVSD